jgi:hypothetical protein
MGIDTITVFPRKSYGCLRGRNFVCKMPIGVKSGKRGNA